MISVLVIVIKKNIKNMTISGWLIVKIFNLNKFGLQNFSLGASRRKISKNSLKTKNFRSALRAEKTWEGVTPPHPLALDNNIIRG